MQREIMEKEKYCCFFHPLNEYSEKSLDDQCPECQKPYGFPLQYPPAKIGEYEIERSLGRGFYGATFIARTGIFQKKCVLKISPKSFYEYAPFNKTPFKQECKLHLVASQGARHIVGVANAFSEVVTFSDPASSSLDCNVLVLDFVDGPTLKQFAAEPLKLSARTVAQIAIDLIRIRGEFEAKQLYHNDLHAGNLLVEQLAEGVRRTDCIDDRIILRAIDLGSIADGSKSDFAKGRSGDLEWIARHVDQLLTELLKDEARLMDRDVRTALVLQGVMNSLVSQAENTRVPNPEDLVELITNEYRRATQHWLPWNEPLRLRTFEDHYNAQTLQPWHAPDLFVDIGGWLEAVMKPGPQIVTGMRGCGKTMLLRSMELHARVAAASQFNANDQNKIVAAIAHDKYVGIFVSAQRLLDVKKDALISNEQRVTRLFLYFALQAARALMHLADVAPSAVYDNAHKKLAQGIEDYIEPKAQLSSVSSISELERRLEQIVVKASIDPKSVVLKVAPAQAFPKLAVALKSCSSAWQGATVFFLLDDVSTRFLDTEKIEPLLSSLLFNDTDCAFKLSSEWQTIELGLQSPGRIHPIRIGRDLTVFDLGSEVHKVITVGKGVDFVSRVIENRAKVHHAHPRFAPKVLLGNQTLQNIAETIASSSATSADRKNAYWGISCLTKVCVGDIGDVIKLYDRIIATFDGTTVPIQSSKQSDCFLSLSSQRIFEINRRKDILKDAAKTFAEASHELLERSYRLMKEGKSHRLREYSSIYVRVTTEDPDAKIKQIDMLRELIDAGIFVYTASGAPRTKTRDSDPLLQFKLTYRKIYGLTSYIGMADRDRFELSGADLKHWLEHPESGKTTLLRNQTQDYDEEVIPEAENSEFSGIIPSLISPVKAAQRVQQTIDLTFSSDSNETCDKPPNQDSLVTRPSAHRLRVEEVDIDDLSSIGIKQVVVGLGFEERTLRTSEILAAKLSHPTVHAVRYTIKGHADEIIAHWQNCEADIREIPDDSASARIIAGGAGLTLVDTSGLSKPFIFHSIRSGLATKGQVLVAYGMARRYYPTPEDIEGVLAAEAAGSKYQLLERLGEILTGERGPYSCQGLLDSAPDETRARALLGFSSAKHQRIFSLLDERDFDEIEIITPSDDGSRSHLSRIAAEVIMQTHQHAHSSVVDVMDLKALMGHCDQQYLSLYNDAGANVEIGLTGSKLQAIAIAALSTCRRFSQAWYVKDRKSVV